MNGEPKITTAEVRQELWELASLACCGALRPEDQARLESLLAGDAEARRFYGLYMLMHAELMWRFRGGAKENDECGMMDEAPIPPIIIDTGGPLQASPFTLHSFVGSPLFAYAAATVIMGVAILVLWAWKVSLHYELAASANSRGLTAPGEDTAREMEPVGRITGMVDCRWADPQATPLVAAVALGRKYELASGLMELSYNSGARVILQGPCTYEVDSATGGFLSLGKLTARVESVKPETANPKSQIPNPKFVVTTPAATITDLGTEFGVEVDKHGAVEVQVIQGRVITQINDPQGGSDGRSIVTKESAVRVDARSKTIVAVAFAPRSFVRTIGATAEPPAEKAYIDAVLADKPLGYWPLNEPARSRRFIDRSGNGFHGHAMAELFAGAGGPFSGRSRAVLLQGNGCIDIGRQDRFAMADGFTVEAWVWIDETAERTRILSAGSSESPTQQSGWSLAYCRETPPEWTGRKSTAPCVFFTTYLVQDVAFADVEMPMKRWTHLVVVFGSDHIAHLFLNGEHRASAGSSGPARTGPTWVTVAGASNHTDYWRGRLAHVAVYAHVLDGKRIKNHYRQARDALPKGGVP